MKNFYFQPITAAVSGGRQKSRGRGKKRKRKNESNGNLSENGKHNKKRKSGRGGYGNKEEQEQSERRREAREISKNNNKSDFEWELLDDNAKKEVTLNSSEKKGNGIKSNGIGKKADSYVGLNYTFELKEGSGELERWRRRLKELLGRRSSNGKEENMVRNHTNVNSTFKPLEEDNIQPIGRMRENASDEKETL